MSRQSQPKQQPSNGIVPEILPASDQSHHVSVMSAEIIEALSPVSDGIYVDATLGGGGHAQAILEASAPNGRLLAFDQDASAIERARLRLAPYGERVEFLNTNFRNIEREARNLGRLPLNGILADLGYSSDQMDDPERGFSFMRSGPLDMRLDPNADTRAYDLVNHLEESDLADLIYEYGEERRSRAIARRIVAARPLESTDALAKVIRGAFRKQGSRPRIDPATRTFQALRIAVNDELGSLEAFLEQAPRCLADGGRLAVISFHSLEDRLVKRRIQFASADCVCPPELPECRCQDRLRLKRITRKPLRPSDAEITSNPRARSARLRIAERIEDAA